MTPERFHQIEELYHAVRTSAAPERAALLAQADPELRRDVESLLAQPDSDKFLDQPAVHNATELGDETVIELIKGTCLGPYRIEGKLGAGGMGVVYKARDQRLDRLVALKVLPADRVWNPELKRRFVQEAKAASALNHPNIVTIYEIDSDGGNDFIAMEFVEGRTLGECIGAEALDPHRAVDYARQITGAFAAAHAKGIVHRDLKPGNVMVTPMGTVKILDFKIAKTTENAQGDNSTLTMLTGEGVVLGTVAYMSPEQAEGKPVDPRSDIFSFGSVLYEMVTGRRAFHGGSKLSILSSILRVDPEPIVNISPACPGILKE